MRDDIAALLATFGAARLKYTPPIYFSGAVKSIFDMCDIYAGLRQIYALAFITRFIRRCSKIPRFTQKLVSIE